MNSSSRWVKGSVRSTCNFSHRVNSYDGWRTRFTIFADDRPTDTTAQCLMNLPNTHSRSAGEGFHTGYDMGRRARTSEPLATDLRRGHASFDTLRNQRGLQLGHRSNDCEHRFPHGALCIDLVLEANKANLQMVELV